MEHNGFKFSVTTEHDPDTPPPWENCEGHGPVTDWVRRSKLPGELMLSYSGSSARYYNYKEACRIALRDKWGARGDTAGLTRYQIAALAALEDYEHLKAWCNNEWAYHLVIVTLLDADGNPTGACMAIGGVVDDFGTYARDLADDICHTYGLNFEGCNELTIGATTWRLT